MWIKTSCCVESSDHRARRRAVLMTLRSTMFWFTEPRIAAPNTNGSLIWNNFQDQTSTATVGISPKNMGKMPQNLLKKVFWKINFIKMIKIFICDFTYRAGWNNGSAEWTSPFNFCPLQLLYILVALFFKFLEHWISINGSGQYAVGEKWDVI